MEVTKTEFRNLAEVSGKSKMCKNQGFFSAQFCPFFGGCQSYFVPVLSVFILVFIILLNSQDVPVIQT